jgi:hypothetical protein
MMLTMEVIRGDNAGSLWAFEGFGESIDRYGSPDSHKFTGRHPLDHAVGTPQLMDVLTQLYLVTPSSIARVAPLSLPCQCNSYGCNKGSSVYWRTM